MEKLEFQVMPDKTPEEFAAFKATIAATGGPILPIVKDSAGRIIDGHHRARACADLGIPCPEIVQAASADTKTDGEKRTLARMLNLSGRHLTALQVRRVIADQFWETPRWSDRKMAEALGVSHSTVGAVRAELGLGGHAGQPAAGGDAPGQPEVRVGRDGKEHAVRPHPTAPSPEKPGEGEDGASPVADADDGRPIAEDSPLAALRDEQPEEAGGGARHTKHHHEPVPKIKKPEGKVRWLTVNVGEGLNERLKALATATGRHVNDVAYRAFERGVAELEAEGIAAEEPDGAAPAEGDRES